MARTPRLTARFLTQRLALRIQAESVESRAIAKAIANLCATDALPEPDHRTWLKPEPGDDRGVALLVDVARLMAFEGRTTRPRLWLCYRGIGEFLLIEAIYDRAPPYDDD